jgi:hypothetical protein
MRINKGTGVRGNLSIADHARVPIIRSGELIPGRKKTRPNRPTIPRARPTLTPLNNNTRSTRIMSVTVTLRLIAFSYSFYEDSLESIALAPFRGQSEVILRKI